MKYGAKCAKKSDLSHGLQPDHNTACSGQGGGLYYGTYRNSGAGCACTGDKQIVSTPSGFPLAYIPETASPANNQTPDNAIAYCRAQGWHLITNPEWMTIARNVEKIPENWCDPDGSHCGFPPGTPGKILVNGHNDGENEVSVSGTNDGALTAATDDRPCFGTTTDGSHRCGGKSSQKRTFTLSNGQVIWDFAGNVWSWVDAEVQRKDQPQSKTHGILDHGWKWSEFTTGGLKQTIITSNGVGPALGYDAFRPSNPSYTATQGVGRIYHYSAAHDTDTTDYTFIRGGTWQHGYDSGAFSIHLSPTADKTNINDVGFRCVATPN
jgi:formylglycine-generating enzyme required for sulfatase activity